MKLSAEITLYPFQESYLPPIKTTISHLGSFDGVEVRTFPTASILFGDYDKVMDAIKAVSYTHLTLPTIYSV